jgi:Transcription factor WhiB
MVLRLRVSSPDDWRDAKCRIVGVTAEYDPFFDDQDEALVFCNGEADGVVCPIREECLRFALTNNHKEGVWGGCSELTRRALRKRWPLQGKTPRPQWRWMSEQEALKGLRLSDLLAEDEDEDDDEEDFP